MITAYVYAKGCKRDAHPRRARENRKVTKNHEVKDSLEVKGNSAGSALVCTRTLVLV